MSRIKQEASLMQEIYNVDKLPNIGTDDFYRLKRHVFVVTDVGKPVYTRFGDESDIGSLCGVFSVTLLKLSNLRSGKPTRAKKIVTSFTKTILRKYGDLVMMFVTKDLKDDDKILERCLEALLHQIVCSITSNFKERMANDARINPGTDLDTHYQSLAWCIEAAQNSFSVLLNSYMPFLMNADLRSDIRNVLTTFKEEGLEYKMIMTRHSIIAMDNDDYDIEPEDLNAIFHLVNSKFNIQGVDYIMPYCVPTFSDKAYMNIYFRLIAEDLGILIIFSDQTKVKECVEMCHKIEITMEDEGQLETLDKYHKLIPLSPNHFSIPKISDIVVLNLKTNQYTLLGSKVYQDRTEGQAEFLRKTSQFLQTYERLKNEDKKDFEFEIYEKELDTYYGCFKDKELLVFAKQVKWSDKETLRKDMIKAVEVIRNDYYNFFLRI